jgi:hypothetical protein
MPISKTSGRFKCAEHNRRPWRVLRPAVNDKLCHEALRIGSSAVFSDVGEKSSNKDLHNVA